MNTRASLAVKKARYERLVEVVESKGQPAWGRSWHWGSQLRIWGGSERTGGRAGKQGGIVHTPHPPVPGKEKTPSVFIWTRNQTSLGHVWLYKPQSCGIRTAVNWGEGTNHIPVHPLALLPSSLLWVGW